MLAYLAMMAPRLVELRRVLKPTGSHLPALRPDGEPLPEDAARRGLRPEQLPERDHLASARLAKATTRRARPASTTLILVLREGDEPTWNAIDVPRRTTQTYMDKTDYASTSHGSDGRRYQLDQTCRTPNPRPARISTYECMGITRVWRWTHAIDDGEATTRRADLLAADRSGASATSGTSTSMPGTPLSDVWTDIPPHQSQAKERLGYPTQKPEALLERIIEASSNEGDVVLDPVLRLRDGHRRRPAAQPQLDRHRHHPPRHHPDPASAHDAFGEIAADVQGDRRAEDRRRMPTRSPQTDPYQFQWWALGLVGARPAEQKKGADKGIDGRLYFHDERGRQDEADHLLGQGRALQAHARARPARRHRAREGRDRRPDLARGADEADADGGRDAPGSTPRPGESIRSSKS